MKDQKSKEVLREYLSAADIRIDGKRPWDMQVRNPDLFRRTLVDGTLGLGESYMDGWWECEALDEFCNRALSVGVERNLHSFRELLYLLHARFFNLQKLKRAFEVGQRHYDIGNSLYRRMLDKRMIYSCGYWRKADHLDAAQEAKLDLICRKLMLEPGMKVLDIGCGWGGAVQYAAQNYGVEAVGITVSREQAAYARDVCSDLPVEIRLQDYRETQGRFDRIFSVGMLEHVGQRNYRTYFEKARRLLKDDGLFLVHTIGGNTSVSGINPWIAKYIFPNSMIPSARQLSEAAEGLFVVEDWHNFGQDYDTTLMSWYRNFQAAWPELKNDYGERFYRMWKFYLLSCAGSFRARRNQTWQIVCSPHGLPGGYTAPR